jgi:hypothetical protein
MENWSPQRIRELSPDIALRGMVANEIGCVRISMMARSMSSKERPDTLVQDRAPALPFSVATYGWSIHIGAKTVKVSALRPVSSDPLRCHFSKQDLTVETHLRQNIGRHG